MAKNIDANAEKGESLEIDESGNVTVAKSDTEQELQEVEVADESITKELKGFKSAKAKINEQDVSAATLVRMLGIPTKTEIKILETKLDLLINKINSLTTKFDTANKDFANHDLSSTLERIETCIYSLKK